jgi:putative hydrolase of the HAD superfamily
MSTTPTQAPVRALFLDIGGVLLTNGWDRKSRKAAAEKFGLNADEISDRHRMTFDTYESGKLSLDEYLARTVFYEERSFTVADFKHFMQEQSQPYAEMLGLIRDLKAKYGLKIAVVNNEGRELNQHRIQHFKLYEFVDFFISSCFVHFRKPDADIWRVALDIAQVPKQHVVYIDDRLMFVQVAESLGLRGINHKSFEDTQSQLAMLGLTL